MNLFRPLWLAASVYVVATLILLFLLTPHQLFTQKLSFFYQDPGIADRVHIAIVDNPNGNHAFLTRFFHNKGTFALNNIAISLARSTDPVFFFSLFNKPYYGDSYYFLTTPLYFPFFLLGLVTLIRKWEKVNRKYRFLLYLAAFSLVIVMLFIPYTAPLKLIPLFITMQLVLFFGCYELAQSVIPDLIRDPVRHLADFMDSCLRRDDK